MDYRIFLKTEFADLDLSEVLQQSPKVLLGVSDDAVTELAVLNAATVFDLANCTLFNNAAQIVDGAADPGSIFARHLGVPNDLLDSSAAGLTLADLPGSSVRNLAGVGVANGPGIETALDCLSIRDLALWPPFVAAKALVGEAFEPFNAIDYDRQSPDELLPRTGQHATQKVIYRKTILIESKPSTKVAWNGDLLDFSLLDEVGFSDVAFGAIMTFHQLWTPRRVALGTLLHSVPLGPGESTRLAVVDWTRRLVAASREDIDQSENLSNSMAQSTAISEITRATANQTQEGNSGTLAIAGSQSSGTTAFLGLGVGTASESTNAAFAATYSVSNTTREETAKAVQNISSHTHQNSSLARNKRAAVVTEVSQRESENLTTRVIANYNHMHALSINYYEVVQIYETELKRHNIERCIFIPMLKVNFRNESNIRRFLKELTRYALDRRTRDLLLQYRNTLIWEHNVDRFATDELNQLASAVDNLPPPSTDPRDGALTSLPIQLEKQIQLRILQAQVSALRRRLAINSDAGYRQGIIQDYDRNDYKKMMIDRGAQVANVYWDKASGITAVNIQLADGRRVHVTEPSDMQDTTTPNLALNKLPIAISNVTGVNVEINKKDGNLPSSFKLFELYFLLSLPNALNQKLDKALWLDASFVHSEGVGGTISVLNLHPPIDVNELANLLMEHQLYYSQQVWLRADTQSLIMQLAPYTVHVGNDTVHVVDYIDPRPITVAGNYLAFRFTYDTDQTWTQWVAKEKQTARPRYDLIPVPTGGVFCEAVLGEFNSAEKLDAGRFWKWQDSPIPFAAPEIAALDAGQHNRVSAPTPGDLQTSGVVKLLDLPALPEGLATSKDVLGALMAENIFKNMGGVETTGKLIQAAQAAAAAGDKATQEQLSNTLNGIMSSFEELATAFLKSPDGVQNMTQMGSIFNKLGGSGSGSGITDLLGTGAGGEAGAAGDAAGAAGGAAGAGDAAGAAGGLESAGGVMQAIGPLMEEIAPLILAAA